MRIAITSDIHYFPRWRAAIRQLAQRLAVRRPDVLILAGDIGEPLNFFDQGLGLFEEVCEHRAALAGNHDVWNRDSGNSSEQLWNGMLEKAAQAHGYTWLERENLVIDGLGISGSIAWYDYGLGHPDFTYDEAFYQRMKPSLSNDGHYVNLPWSDREFAAQVAGSLIERIETLEHNPVVQDVLVVTHVPPFADILKPPILPEQYVINAYYVNFGLGENLLGCRKVRAVVSGHVHHEQHVTIGRGGSPDCPPIGVHTIPSDYGRPVALLLDTNTWETSLVRS